MNSLHEVNKCELYFNMQAGLIISSYQNKYQNLQCMLCQSGEEDNQYHLFHCSKLIDNLENLANNVDIEYEDFFGDISRQIPAAKLLSLIWIKRNELIEQG